nr:MAG TPA: hypothetical protein [Caudoviricetes sp.]
MLALVIIEIVLVFLCDPLGTAPNPQNPWGFKSLSLHKK